MPLSGDPVVQRRRLRAELRRIRKGAGQKQQDVVEAMDWSLSKLIRIESGAVGVSTNDLRALLQHYGVTDPKEVDRLVEMSRASRESPWWSAYRDVIGSPQYETLLGYEGSASAIYQFHMDVVPGLLQDEEYSRALLGASRGAATSEGGLERRLEFRLRRQQMLLDRPDRPEYTVILDEAVLHRQVGDPDIMRRQFHHLRDLASWDRVTIEVVPFSEGTYTSMAEPFMLLEFPGEDEDILYFEGPTDSLITREDQELIAVYRQTFETLRALAGKTDLETMLDKALAEMAGSSDESGTNTGHDG